MVNIPTLEAMKKDFEDNLGNYVREHPGEFVLYEGSVMRGITHRFFETRESVVSEVEKHGLVCGFNYIIEKIPESLD